MKGKIFSVLLAFCLLFTMLPTTVSAAELKDFTFTVEDNMTADLLSGVKGTISIMRDGAIIQTHEVKEITVTGDDYSYAAYTVQLDVSTLESTDVFLCNLSCHGYYPLNEDVETALLDEWSMLGTVAEWEDIEYAADEMWAVLEPWEEGARAVNDVYYVGESEENGTPYVYIAYEGVWNEDTFIEALSYVEKSEVLYVNICNWSEDIVSVPKLSARLMQELGKYNMAEIFYQIENGLVGFYNLKGTTDFVVTIEKGNNSSVNKLFKSADVTTGYFEIKVSGDATFTDSYVEYIVPAALEGVLTFPKENIVLDSNGFGISTTVKSMYRYDAEKNICYLVDGVDYQYAVGDFAGDQDYYAIVLENGEINKCDTYIITDVNLPPSITTEKWVPVDTINASMTTAEVTTTVTDAIKNAATGSTVEVVLPKAMNIGADAMKQASATATPIAIAVEKTADNSYVNWFFEKIDNPVEFNPSVHVDATVAAVDTRLAAVALPSTLKMTTVSFDFDGTLPGAARVTLDMANSSLAITNTGEGAAVYLYYYNPTGNIFELMDESTVTNGYATFNMTHCSDYVVTSEKLPTSATTVQTPEPDNGNNNNGTTDNNGTTNNNNGTTTNTNTIPASPKTGEANGAVWGVLIVFAAAVAVVLRKRNTVK